MNTILKPNIEPNIAPKYWPKYWNPILKLNIEHNIETNFGSKIFLDQKFFDLDSFVPNIFGTNFFEQQQQPQLKWVLTQLKLT